MRSFTDKDLAEFSLYEFFRQAWSTMEGKILFVDEWYLRLIAKALEDCFYRRIKNLLINLPPRKGKTNLISIAFPAWCWLHNPQEKFICASYTNFLSLNISDRSRMLIKSPWFQKNWGDKFKIRRDQSAKGYFANDKTGYRMSTSVGSFFTGSGGSIQITDDPNNPKGSSEAEIEKVNSWWSSVWSNRLNDPANDVRIVVQQRSQNQNDISGNIIANDSNKEWVKLILPMEYELGVKTDIKDIRTKEGEFLSVRDTVATVNRLKIDLRAHGYAAQCQQRPAPLAGGMIKKAWFKPYKSGLLPEEAGFLPAIEHIIQSWDTALTGKSKSNYSACTTWGVFTGDYGIPQIILLSSWRGRLEFPELRDRVIRLSRNYTDVYENKIIPFIHKPPNEIIVEAKASGDPLISTLREAGILAIPFIPDKYGDKIQRVRLITHLIEAGIVYMPTDKLGNLTRFADEFVTAVSYFPNPDARDLVDTMVQAIIKLKLQRYIDHPRNDVYAEQYKPQEILYR